MTECTRWYWTGHERVQCALLEHGGGAHWGSGYSWKDCPESVCGHSCVMHEGHLGDHADETGERWSRVFVANNSADFYCTKATSETLWALKNSGIDISCGACMSVAFSGSTTASHTCVKPPLQLELHCPMCGRKHVDSGEFATKPHHTHSCQNPGCGHTWRPAVQPTVGVACLPGFVSERTEADEAVLLLACRLNHLLFKHQTDASEVDHQVGSHFETVPARYRELAASVEEVKELLSRYLPTIG